MRVGELIMKIYGQEYDPDTEVFFYRRADYDSHQEGVVSMQRVDDKDVRIEYFEGSKNFDKHLTIILE